MTSREYADHRRFTPRRVLAVVGQLFIGVGVLMLLFVVYVLWGTGILNAEHQNALRNQFEHELHKTGSTTTTAGSDSPPTTEGFSGVQPAVPGSVPAAGQPVGIIQIPKIGVNKIVVEGTGTSDLQLGPGHYAGTPLPGQPGNAAIAGHRTTYGAPFYNLNELTPGDLIYVTTTQGRFQYRVAQAVVVSPSDTSVVADSSTPELTLTTCNPRFSATSRLVVHAVLLGAPAAAPPHASPTSPSSTRNPGTSQLAGEQGSWGGALTWGAGFLALGIVIWMVARDRRGRWLFYSIGVVPLLFVLFFFFENLSPLLPASF